VRAAALALLLAGCGGAPNRGDGTTAVTVATASGEHVFHAAVARTEAEQSKGLKGRTVLAPDAGLLIAPYPPTGGGPQVATLWMKDTAVPLDMVFVRADGSVAKVAANAVPMSETMISSGEPVAAILEIAGGRAAAVGLKPGDRVRWTAR